MEVHGPDWGADVNETGATDSPGECGRRGLPQRFRERPPGLGSRRSLTVPLEGKASPELFSVQQNIETRDLQILLW